ncbi:MAG: AMP-binding protein, partial [Deltaproteobacteria bacterium]|nr:AMP-binding protein [Deltaproteobacteria bacterium]
YWLVNAGVKKGDRVAFILENSLEYVLTYYGTLKAGAVAVSLSTDIKPDSLNGIIAELEPAVIITNSRFERLIKASDQALIQRSRLVIHNPKLTWDSTGIKVCSFEEVVFNPKGLKPKQLISEYDLASIIFTSGSTGKPKGVMLSHKNIVANTGSICEYLELTYKDIQMVVLPFFYVMGKSLLNTHFSVGGTVVINNRFAYPATVINQMIEEKVTGFSGVPSTYAYLLHRSPLEKHREDLTSLRYCSQAGGHLAKQIKLDLKRALPDHTKIVVMYGATEASARLTWLDPAYLSEKIDSIGKAIPGVTIKILDADGQEVECGKEGQIVGYGPNIMQGYYKDKETTDKVLINGGYYTGDLGYKDKDGFLFTTGRRDNLLKVKGHRINVQEIEDILMDTGLLIEAVVMGIKDDLLGNRLVSLAVPVTEEMDEKTILKKCAEMLPDYKLPGRIMFIRSLPKNSNEEVDRAKCAAMLV